MDKLEQIVELRIFLDDERSRTPAVSATTELNADFANFSERIKKLLHDAKDHIQNARTELSSKVVV